MIGDNVKAAIVLAEKALRDKERSQCVGAENPGMGVVE